MDRREQSAADDWLAAHPPVIEWWPNGVMPIEIPSSEPIVETILRATSDVGRPGGCRGWTRGMTARP